ncbi:MAG: GGDEF domain-containing protein [Candidatus Korobacteraceae bacterium]
MNFAVLPNLIALAILVAVFRAILLQGTTERLHLWLAGWILVLVHFAAQFLDTGQGTWSLVATAIGLDALILASVAFLISVSTIVDSDSRRQILFASAIALPALAYTNAIIWDVTARSFYYCVVAVGLTATTLLFCRYYGRISLYAATVLTGSFALAGTIAWTVARGTPGFGISYMLAGLNFVVAMLYWRRYRRASAGVLTTVGGFVLWGAVFPTGILLQLFAPSLKIDSEVWNIPKYLVAVGMILTLLEDQIATSKHLAYHDALTGLPNRRLLEDRLEQALAHADRTGNKVAVLQLDLDRFKQVNDTFGHHIGDLALQEIVRRLSSRMRSSDTLARSGGDEFTVVSTVADSAGAEVLVSDLESALSAPINIGGARLQTGLSIGLALYPDNGHDPDQLHAAADEAMYAAKRATRGSGLITTMPQPSV